MPFTIINTTDTIEMAADKTYAIILNHQGRRLMLKFFLGSIFFAKLLTDNLFVLLLKVN
jgi:hypothetical protein